MQNQMCIVTGARGFLGEQLCEYLAEKHIRYRACVRHGSRPQDFACSDLATFNNWTELFHGADTVLHLAGKAHDMTNPPDSEYFRNNTEVTIKLASEAKKARIKRFVFISTIKVNGEYTHEEPFTAEDRPRPQDAYARSKYEAELGLLKLHEEGLFEVCIIRPSLIYGPKAKANFQKLISLVKRQSILPFGAIHNKRSLVSVYNLTDLITTCMTHPKASGQIFLASDGEELSLSQMIRQIATALNKRCYLVPVPFFIMNFLFYIFGLRSLSQRLFGNLHVDIQKNRQYLGWVPQYNLKLSLAKWLEKNNLT